MTTRTATAAARFETTSAAQRASAFGLAAVVTLSVLFSLDRTADHHYDDALLAQADSAPTQVVVVTGQRPARA